MRLLEALTMAEVLMMRSMMLRTPAHSLLIMPMIIEVRSQQMKIITFTFPLSLKVMTYLLQMAFKRELAGVQDGYCQI